MITPFLGMVEDPSQIAKDLKVQNDLYKQVQELREIEVFVGIPEENTERNEGEMNNATLLYIHTKGSPIRNLPARPVIEPALVHPQNAEKIAEDLKAITQAALDGNEAKAKIMAKLAGQDAVNMVKDWFENSANNWEPNAPATVKAKLRKIKDKRRRKEAYLAYQVGGSVDTVLVDTAQMRNAITFVVKDGK